MNRFFIYCLSFLLLLTTTSTRQTNAKQEADIVIYGATSAGVIAAYTAKQMGKSVLLIDPGQHLGGLTTGGLGFTDIGNKFAISGLSLDFYRKVGQKYGRFEQWTFEPSAAKKILQSYLDEVGVKVQYGTQVVSTNKNGSKITSVDVLHVSDNRKSTVAGKVFIDATYEGDLLANAGVSYFVGREDNSVYNETINGYYFADYQKEASGHHQFPDHVDPYIKKGDPTSGLLWGISKQAVTPKGSGDKLVQAYNFRICLTDSVENRIPITKPADYDPAKYELLVRLIEKQPTMKAINNYFIWSHMPNRKTDINNRGGFSTDMIGHSHTWAEASWEERAKIYEEHKSYTLGLLYFTMTDPRVPKEVREYAAKWGLPKDEYQSTGNWSPQMYIREGRRLVGEYVMTEANCRGDVTVSDAVGMAAYTMDSHNTQRIIINGMVKNEGNVEVGGFPPYPISYRALLPKRNECTNLIVPVCLSSSHIAFGSIRMEPVFMVLAQSSGIAAALAINSNVGVQDVNASEIQKILKSNPLMNGTAPEILVDNNDDKNVQIVGAWKATKRGGYGFGYVSTNVGSEQSLAVQFKPQIAKTGKYKVYTYLTKVDGLSPEIGIRIKNGKAIKSVVLNTESMAVIGQTSGEWYPVGSFEFTKGSDAFVEINNKLSKGVTVADAVLLIPEK